MSVRMAVPLIYGSSGNLVGNLIGHQVQSAAEEEDSRSVVGEILNRFIRGERIMDIRSHSPSIFAHLLGFKKTEEQERLIVLVLCVVFSPSSLGQIKDGHLVSEVAAATLLPEQELLVRLEPDVQRSKFPALLDASNHHQSSDLLHVTPLQTASQQSRPLPIEWCKLRVRV